MKREKIADIAAKFYPLPIKSGRDIIKMDDWCDKFADEIMALPLDLPSEEEIKEEVKNPKGNNIYLKAGTMQGRLFGAKWAIAEIIKRNGG